MFSPSASQSGCSPMEEDRKTFTDCLSSRQMVSLLRKVLQLEKISPNVFQLACARGSKATYKECKEFPSPSLSYSILFCQMCYQAEHRENQWEKSLSFLISHTTDTMSFQVAAWHFQFIHCLTTNLCLLLYVHKKRRAFSNTCSSYLFFGIFRYML